jgi:hypothetical protein
MSDITWTNTRVRLGDLKPWSDNPRMSTKAQAKRLLASFDKFGQVQTVAVDPDCNVLDGHQRLSALLTLHGDGYELDARQSNRALTDNERQELVVSLHAGAVGSWDWDKVSSWSAADLQGWGMDKDLLKGWNNDANNLKELLKSEQPSADADVSTDRAAELLAKWQVQPGDLWEIGAHRLMCGDCTSVEDVERLKADETPDLSFTDPPYNVGKQYGEKTNDDQSKADFIEWCHGWTVHLPERHLLTVGIKRLCWWDDILGDPRWIIAWVKRNGQGQTGLGGTNKWDAILCYGVKPDNQPDMIELNNDYSEGIKANGGHPTAKPVELWQRVIERFDGQLIYEPFGGSGTTMIAAENLKRRALLLEIEPKYCAVALERMSLAFPALPIRRLDTVS